MYEKACDVSELSEGKFEVAVVKRTLMLIVWPRGGEPRAFQGICPHAKEPLADGHFDGKDLECHHHEWTFDGTTGKCIRGKSCQLAEYPLKIEDGVVMVDVEGIEPVYIDGAPSKLEM